MSLGNVNYSINQSHLTNLVGPSNMVGVSNQSQNQYVLAFQPNQWTDSRLVVSSSETDQSKVQAINGCNPVAPQIISQIGLQPVTMNTPHSSSVSTDNLDINACINHQTQTQLFQPNFSQLSSNNQSQSLNSQMFSQVQPQYLLTSNRPTFNLGSQLPQIAYQTVPGTTQVIIPSHNNNTLNESQITSPHLLSTINSSLNHLIQIVSPNGQVMTTTLANLQNLGINAISAANGPFTTYQYANNVAAYSTFGQQNQAISAQLMTNAAGQIFAITSQGMSGITTQQNSIITDNSSNSTSQFFQITSPQISEESIISNQVSNINSPNISPESNANDIIIQQVTEEQQQKIHQKAHEKKANTSVTISRVTLPIPSSNQKFQKNLNKVNQAIQVSLSSNSVINPNLTSQSTVSSTTSITSKEVINYSFSKSNLDNLNENIPNVISVESQTLSTSPHSNGGYSMEPESTTQNTATVANTISNTDASIVDGVNLAEIKEFARQFKLRRLSLGLTQTQVGQALSATEGPSYSQSAICRFEKLDITPKSAQKIKPVLETWMEQAEERYKNGSQTLTDFIGNESSKKRKRRTSFTPSALELLNNFFEKNTHPSGLEMTELADKLNYDREVVRVWFCNKRQALRNTMKKDISPHMIIT